MPLNDEVLAGDEAPEEVTALSLSAAVVELLAMDKDVLDAEEATVSRVVATIGAELAAAAMLGNDPAPHRHAPAH